MHALWVCYLWVCYLGLLFEQCQLQYVGSDQIESGCFACILHLHGSLKGTIAKIKNCPFIVISQRVGKTKLCFSKKPLLTLQRVMI